MELLKILQPELRLLSAEAAKKFPDIKEAAERSEVALRSIEEKFAGKNSESAHINAIALSEDIIAPFLFGCRTKNAKLVIISVTSLHKLISRNAISSISVPNILRVLSEHLESNDESILLKLLQTLVSLLTSEIQLNGEPLAKGLGMMFKLHSNKNTIVQNTASASLRQICVMIFDKAQNEFNSVSSSSSSSTPPELLYSKDAYNLILDICNLTGGDAPKWFQIPHISPSFGIELLETIISTHHSYVKNSAELLSLLQDRICPLVIKKIQPSNYSFVPTIRIVRLMSVIITRFANILAVQCEVFIMRLLKALKSETPIWLQTMVLEIFRDFAQNPPLLLSFYRNYDLHCIPKYTNNNNNNSDDNNNNEIDSDNIINKNNNNQSNLNSNNEDRQIVFQIISGISNFVQSNFEWDKHMVVCNTRSQRVVDMLNQLESPVINSDYILNISTEIFSYFIDSIAVLADTENFLRNIIYNPKDNFIAEFTFTEDQLASKNITESCWLSIFGALSILLSRTHNDPVIQYILLSYHAFIITCCILGLNSPRDALILALSKLSYPPNRNILKTTKTNIHAMKSLLKLTHNFGNVLTTSWKLILQSIDSLYTFIHQPIPDPSIGSGSAQSSQKSSNHISPQIYEELNSLMSNIDNLFSNSNQLLTSALVFLVSGLCEINAEYVLSSAVQNSNSPNRSFILSKLLEVSLQNVHRIDAFWEIEFEHFKQTCNQKNKAQRNLLIDSFGQIITSAFTHFTKSQVQNSNSPPATPPKTSMDAQSQIYMQNRFLEALEELSRSQYPDVRQKSLDLLHTILQSAAQVITKGWPLVLSILMTVAVNDDKPHISLGFKSVSLICADFLSYLPLDCLALFITTIGCYGLQSSDINISLTAIGLLFSIADFLGKAKNLPNFPNFDHSSVFIESSPLSSSNRSSSSSDLNAIESQAGNHHHHHDDIQNNHHNQSNGSTEIKSDDDEMISTAIEKLWISLLTEMKQLSLDQRFDVRNCSLITMFKTLHTHGGILEANMWSNCIWEILLPMISDIRSSSSAAANEELNVELGKQGGKTVKLLVHHSRNNAQKQWDETIVLSFSGFSRLLKSFFTTLNELQSFDELWKQWIKFAEILAFNCSKEVAENVIGNVRDVMLTLSLQDSLWLQCWDALERISNQFSNNNNIPSNNNNSNSNSNSNSNNSNGGVSNMLSGNNSESSLSLLTQSVLSLHSQLRSKFSSADIQRLIRILATLCMKSSRGSGGPSSNLTPVQKTILEAFDTIDIDDDDIAMELFNQLFLILFDTTGNSFDSPQSNRIPNQSNFLLTENIIEMALNLYENRISVKVRVEILPKLIGVIGAAMSLKFHFFHCKLWRTAVHAMILLSRVGIFHLEKLSSQEVNRESLNESWSNFAKAIDRFLFHDRKLLPQLTQNEQKEEVEIDVQIIHSMKTHLFPVASKVKFLHPELINIIVKGISDGDVKRSLFSQSCYKILFSLAENGNLPEDEYSCNLEIAQLAITFLMGKSAEVIQRFIEEDHKAGKFPVTKTRLEEMTIVLNGLKSLVLHPGLVVVNSKSQQLKSFPNSSKRHLLLLFPLFCDCITTKEDSIKQILKEIFHTVAAEVNLV